MAVYLVERTFVEALELDDPMLRSLEDDYATRDIRWITSLLSPDKRKSYCLYEAPSADELVRHAAEQGLPLDTVVEVSDVKHALG